MSRKIPARAAGPRAAPPPIELDPRLTIVQAAELHRTMAARLEGNWPVIVDGTRVEEIDTAVLQLLTSLWCTGRERGIACTWWQILVTNGYQDALGLIADVLLAPNDKVWFEDPCYPLARAAFEALGARLVPVRVDAEGVAGSRRRCAGAARATDGGLAFAPKPARCRAIVAAAARAAVLGQRQWRLCRRG